MVTRIATAANNAALVTRMLALQSRVQLEQQQLSTGFKSDNYTGISAQASRLLNIENQQGRIENYLRNNLSASTLIKTQLQSVQGIHETASDIQGELVTLSGQDFTSKSPANVQSIADIQQKAFAALSQIAYFLNQKVDGKFVFAGGRGNQQPVDFPYGSVGEFQQTFDGITTVFPTTRVANMINMGFNNVGVTYNQTAVGGENYTEVSAAPASFVTSSMTEANFGTLSYVNVGTNAKVTATSVGAFKSIQVGQTLGFDDTAGGSNNNGIYTVTAVSPDGTTITLDQNVNAGTDATATINLLVPNGTTMGLTGSSLGNNGAYTINWPSNADLQAAGYANGDGAPPQDGSVLLISPQVVAPGAAETISLNSTSFLTGANLVIQQKISDTQTIAMDVTALDPAFEKVIRGLGLLCQGDLLDNPSRISQALGFINDGIEHSSLETTELPSDLGTIENRLSLAIKTLNDTSETHKQLLAFLENRQNDIEKADPTETAVRLNADSTSLQVSYATLAKISSLSLLNYL